MIKENINEIHLILETFPGCFSSEHIDKGTLAMLSYVDIGENDKVLDLGCGYGVVGIYAAKITCPSSVYMTDICNDAVECAKKNAVLNGIEGINAVVGDALDQLNESDFDIIMSNPPYHTDFSIAKKFIEKGFNRLKIGGRFYMVTKRRKWYKNKFISIFGGVKIYEKDGYFIFEAEKRCNTYNSKTPKNG